MQGSFAYDDVLVMENLSTLGARIRSYPEKPIGFMVTYATPPSKVVLKGD